MYDDPETELEFSDEDASTLDPATYHRVVGPALRAAAETAARRGHRLLFDDMPAMLALVDMITRLVDLEHQNSPDSVGDGRGKAVLDEAAASACVMVFRKAELSEDDINGCLVALRAAYRQINEQSVIEEATPYIAMAWSHMEDGQRDPAHESLIQASRYIIAAIEVWREHRYGKH